MPVSAVPSGTSTDTYTRNTSNDSRDMKVDTQTFLTMLVTQLKYQDPLSPQDNSQFLAQLAQMSTLSEMQDMSNALKNAQAYDMIGKEISATVTDPATNTKKTYTGVVTSIVIKDGIPYVVVDNTVISIADVTEIFPAPVTTDATENRTDTDTPAAVGTESST